jgi:hypothetical protein
MGGLFDRQIGGLRAAQNLGDKGGGTAHQRNGVCLSHTKSQPENIPARLYRENAARTVRENTALLRPR